MRTDFSATKNKDMDSMKSTSIAPTQAKSKLYSYINYLRGASFVNRLVVDGVEGKDRQTSQLQKTKAWIPWNLQTLPLRKPDISHMPISTI